MIKILYFGVIFGSFLIDSCLIFLDLIYISKVQTSIFSKMSIFARKWTPRAHGGKADLFKNDQKMIENDQEMIENDQEMIENGQKSHGALIMGPKGALIIIIIIIGLIILIIIILILL